MSAALLLPLPVVLPLLGAALSLLAHRRPGLQRALGLVTLTAVLAVAVVLLVQVDGQGHLVARLGGWSPTVGIVLVADRFSAMMLVTSSLMLLAVLAFAIGGPGTRDTATSFHPVYLTLSAGLGASFLTGDLFNLFVAFEVTLMSSYVLMTLDGDRAQVRSGMTYAVISLVASALFVATVGLLYAATGTVNMADLAGKVGNLPDGLRAALGLLLFLVFGVKAAIFPLFSWLPDSYPTAPSSVTAIFAGLLTKVGVYAIIRTQTLVFPVDGADSFLLLIAGLTMVVGVLGAIAQGDMKRILSFHIVSQIGYMIMGLGLDSVAALAATVLFIVHNIVIKTQLLLVAGVVEHTAGSADLGRIGGLAHRSPLVGVLFLLPALSLAGLPPFSGFVAKLGLVQAGLAAGAWAIVAVSLAVSACTLFSMTKIWNGAFWGEPDGGRRPTPAGMSAPVGLLVIAGVALAVLGGPAYDLSLRAAEDLADVTPYVEAVLG